MSILLHINFSAESDSEIILKICQYSVKIWNWSPAHKSKGFTQWCRPSVCLSVHLSYETRTQKRVFFQKLSNLELLSIDEQ